MRKIIQICAIPTGEATGVCNNRPALYALCNDHTIWQLEKGEWQKAPDISQDDYDETPEFRIKCSCGYHTDSVKKFTTHKIEVHNE